MEQEDLTDQQAEAVRAVEDWRASQRSPVFRLNGGAGTGKTTIAKLLARTASSVLYAAPTGKAAAVLSSKGCPAQTIHQLIYQPMEAGKTKLEALRKEEKIILGQIETTSGPDAELRSELRTVREKIREEEAALQRPFFALKTESALREANLLVLDESSMVDQITAEDLMSFGCPILALGDPFQLPPVRGTGYFAQEKADYLLTEIHRQALGSPILELATMVREGRGLPLDYHRETEAGRATVQNSRPSPELVMGADQILCGRNATRQALNARCRTLLGRTDPLPQEGDRLVCLSNNHDLGLMNGTIWIVARNYGGCQTGRMVLDLVSEEGRTLTGVDVHEAPFRGQQIPRWEARDAEQFDYGYALTVHKAQGSQWDSVVLFDDWNSQDRRQWLYTGVTRAARSLVVVQ